MPGAGRFLVIEDDALSAGALARAIRRRGFGECVIAGTAKEADARLRDGTAFSAIVVDIGLPDGCGLDLLAAGRDGLHALTPAAVLSGSYEPRLINRAAALDAKYLVKPIEWDKLAIFFGDAISLDRRVTLALRPFHLPNAEADLVRRRALGESTEETAAARGASEETLKKQRANAVRHSGERSFERLVERVLRDVARSR
jgi:DNA-binding response OmpR family regulator